MDEEALTAAAAMGMGPAEVAAKRQEALAANEAACLEIWPENWRPFLLAEAMQTQIRTTMYGAIGFDYSALPIVEARITVAAPEDPQDQAADFAAFRHLESIYFSK